MGKIIKYYPPEGSPLASCSKQVDNLRIRNKMLRIALLNLLAMEEFRSIRGEESELHSGVVLQVKSILKIT